MPRVLTIAAALLALGFGVAIFALALADRSPDTGAVSGHGGLETALPGADEIAQSYRGIPQHGRVLGRRSAPVTMVEYLDLQCPYCRDFAVHALPGLVARYVRAGTLKIELRPIAFLGPDSERGRRAVLAAAQQGRFFHFVDLLFYNQGAENSGWLSDRLVRAAAASVAGLDVPALLSAVSKDSLDAERLDDLASLQRVQGTPTVFVGKSGHALRQVHLTSVHDPVAVRAAIEDARA